VPACGFADCTRAASDPAPPALRPGREELATGERRKIRSLSQEAQPEAEPEVTAWRVPRRSAERRARPQADVRGNAKHSWRAPYRPRIRMLSSEVPVRRLSTRLSALRPPYFIRGGFRAVAWQSSGEQKTRRENDAAYPSPRSGEGGPSCAARWWKGRRTRRFAFVARVSLRPAPPPPRCYRSAVPLPRFAGKDKGARRRGLQNAASWHMSRRPIVDDCRSPHGQCPHLPDRPRRVGPRAAQ
jgi:hypothetical protein